MIRYPLVALATAVVLAPAAVATDSPSKSHALKLRGSLVRVSAEAVSVENALGDLVLTCRLGEDGAAHVAGFAVGDRVVVKCVRRDGKPASLVRIERLGAEKDKPKHDGEVVDIAGVVVEAGAASLTVKSHDTGRTLTCAVPAAFGEKVAKLRPGVRVKMACKAEQLVWLALVETEAKPVEQKAYGRIVALSARAVTVSGEAGSLTCEAPDWFAEKVARFAVGDIVKMLCRGGELTFLEKQA